MPNYICYCELASEHFVIENGKGCELCCKEQGWKEFTPENVNKIFKSLWEELCKHQNAIADLEKELHDLREATKNNDMWIDP